MKQLSVILPVYNVAKYLPRCIESLLGQTLDDFEIIFVNDGSPDNSIDILKEYEAKYPDKITVYTIENHGVSYARNYGAEHANGEYLLFVDSDDYVEPNYCKAMLDKALKDGNDLVLCSRYDVYENAKDEVKNIKPINLMTANQNFKMEDCSYEMLWLTPFPWDKLVKKDLFMTVKFPIGIRFEDLCYVLKIAVMAQSIGVVRDRLYNYRRNVGFLNSFTGATLDIIKAFDNAWNFMKEEGVSEKYQQEVEYICARHFFYRYPALLKKDGKDFKLKQTMVHETTTFLNDNFPDWKENHYLKYSSADFIRSNLQLYCNEKKMNRIIKYTALFRVIPFSKFWTAKRKVQLYHKKYRRATRDVRKVMRKKLFKKSVFGKCALKVKRLFHMPSSFYYTKAYNRYKVDKSYIFLESKHGEDIAGNIFNILRSLQKEEFKNYHIGLVLIPEKVELWETLKKHYGFQNVEIILMGTKQYYKALASAGYLATDTSFPPYYIKKSDQVYLNTWHGTPLKEMGRSVAGREYGLGNVQRNFYIADWLLYQNEFSRDIFVDDYMIRNIYPGKIMMSGYPRNSALYHSDLSAKIRKEHNLEGKKLIAYMPTWRGLLHKKNFALQVGTILTYLYQLDKKLDDSTIFFVRLHPFVGDAIDFSNFRHIRPFLPEYDTYDFLNVTDMLVTDYSSIMFDYAVSGKKIILFAYDKEQYLNERGMYIDLDTIEFPVVETIDELVAEFDRPNQGYPKFHEEYCSHDGENVSDDVCRTWLGVEEKVFVEQTQKVKEKPNVLIYFDGIKGAARWEPIIEKMNQLNLNAVNYYLCFQSGNFYSATTLLGQLDRRIGYIPLQRGIDATFKDYFAKLLLTKFGIGSGWFGKTLETFEQRECQKNFGQIKFDKVLYKGVNSHNLKMLSYATDNLVVDITEFSPERFEKNKTYRKFMKLIMNDKMGVTSYLASRDSENEVLYNRMDKNIRCRVVDNEWDGVKKLMEEV